MTKIYGNIHSIETCGTVDGPGVRFVVFTQGCPMRCLYCHNPDTWGFSDNKRMSVDEILSQYEGVKEFCKGGITVTGGEPLAQIGFVTELFKKAKEKEIHTALDTSGIYFNLENIDKIDELLEYTDLVLLDIKHIDNEEHKKLTGHSNKNVKEFAKYLSANKKPVWIRHVVVPGITYQKKWLKQLGEFLSELDNVSALDILPYHNLGITKYQELGIKYGLEETEALGREEALKARNIVIQSYQESKKEK